MYRPVMLTRLGLVLLSLTQIKDASGPEEQKCGWLVFSVHGSFQRLPSNTRPPLFLPSHPTPSGRVSSTSKHFTTTASFLSDGHRRSFCLKVAPHATRQSAIRTIIIYTLLYRLTISQPQPSV